MAQADSDGARRGEGDKEDQRDCCEEEHRSDVPSNLPAARELGRGVAGEGLAWVRGPPRRADELERTEQAREHLLPEGRPALCVYRLLRERQGGPARQGL